MTQGHRSNQTIDPLRQEGIAIDGWPKNGSIGSTSSSSLETEVDISWRTPEYELIEEIHPVKWSTQIRDLGDEQYELNDALMIVIEEYPDSMIIARYPEIEAFGEGETDTEAMLQLKADIIRLYEDLIPDDPADLGPLPRAWRRILNKVMTKV